MALLWPGRCCSRRQGGCQQHRAEAQRRPKGQDAAGTPALPGDAVPAVRWGERKGSHTRHTLERVEPRRLYGCAGGGASGVGWPPTASAFAWRLGFCDSPREGSDWSVDGGREAGGAAVIRGMFRGGRVRERHFRAGSQTNRGSISFTFRNVVPETGSRYSKARPEGVLVISLDQSIPRAEYMVAPMSSM